jgi:hypothetical protein
VGWGGGECLIEFMLLFRGILMLTILTERSRENERVKGSYERVDIPGRLSNAVYHLGTFTVAALLQSAAIRIGHKVFVAFRRITEIRDREYNGIFFSIVLFHETISMVSRRLRDV